MKEVVLVIDMLNDFVLPGAPLEVPRGRQILSALKERIEKARQDGGPVVYVCDAHEIQDREFRRMNWPAHGVKGTSGAQVVAELAPKQGDFRVDKQTYSCFFNTNLDEILRSLDARELVLTGLVTNICVFYAAYEAVLRGYRVRVPRDCVADLDEQDGAFALNQMEKILGVILE